MKKIRKWYADDTDTTDKSQIKWTISVNQFNQCYLRANNKKQKP